VLKIAVFNEIMKVMWYSRGMASTKRANKQAAKPKRGPVPDVLKIDGNWKDAVKKSLAKKKPAAGWPK
jgi:hypothetical protein